MSAIIEIAGSLLGGLFGRSAERKAAAQARAWALEDQRLQWVRHREASELGGFNPLATLGLSQGVATTPVGGGNFMGTAIADSALLLADNIARTKAAQKGGEAEKLKQENSKLQRKLTDAVIRPKVPGVYQRAQAFGTGAANVDAANTGVGFPAVSRRHVPVGLHVKSVGIEEANITNAEDFEKRYGDAGSSIIGLGIMAADAGATARRYMDRYWSILETERRYRKLNPLKHYVPWQAGGYDALTGSRNPSARLQ